MAAFFLAELPEDPEPLHDFRLLPGVEVADISPELRVEMRRARHRRVTALELLAELGIEQPRFPLRADLADDAEAVADNAREWLDVSVAEQESWQGEYGGLNGWIAALERRGVLVFQTRAVDLEEMRGFSLSEDVLPVVVLNGSDWPQARVFTLMHELSHLMLSFGGICDPTLAGREGRNHNERVEVFCNRVSGAILVPAAPLLNDPRVSGVDHFHEWDDRDLRGIADRFSVSREVVLLRLLSLNRATNALVSRRLEQYREEYAARADRARGREGFPPFYRMVVRDNGRRYTSLVLEALERGRITLPDVSAYLGVRLKHLQRIADEVQFVGAEG